MKKLFFLIALAAIFCCNSVKAQFTMISAGVNQQGQYVIFDSLDFGEVIPTGTYSIQPILLIANQLNNAVDLNAGDTIFVQFALNGRTMDLSVSIGDSVKVNDRVAIPLGQMNLPGTAFKDGVWANTVSSKVTGRTVNNVYTAITDEYPFEGHFTTHVKNVGVNEAALENVRIYPNPVRNSLNIENANNLLVNIYAANGQLVKNVTANGNTTISVNDLTAGLYIVKMQSEKATRVEKIQVVR